MGPEGRARIASKVQSSGKQTPRGRCRHKLKYH